MQYPPGQSPSTAQVVAQPRVAEQVNPWQPVVAPATHFPLPSQVEADVKPEVPQLAAKQIVLLPNFWQAPLPSQ